MQRALVCAGLVACALVAAPASADDTVVQFQDGRLLGVQSFEIVRGWVRLATEDGGYVLAPLSGVDTIRSAGRRVYTRPVRPVTPTKPLALQGAAAARRLVAAPRGLEMLAVSSRPRR